MTVWIWLGIGLATGLVASAVLRHLNRPAVPSLPAVAEDDRAAELARTQMKLAITQDRLAQATSAFERERSEQKRAMQLRLAATEAAYQRQMLAMQPRLRRDEATDMPLQINIHVGGSSVKTATEATTVQPAGEDAADTPSAAAAAAAEQAAEAETALDQDLPTDSEETGRAEPLLLAAPSEPLLLTEERPDLSLESVTEDLSLAAAIQVAETSDVVLRSAPEEDLLAAIGVGAPLDPLVQDAAAGDEEWLQEANEGDAWTPDKAAEDMAIPLAAPETIHLQPPAQPQDRLQDGELAHEEVGLFLAVARGEVEDLHDGLEPRASQASAEDVGHADDDGQRPWLRGAPLEDLDDLADNESRPWLTDTPPRGRTVLPWYDELDADFAEEDAWGPKAARADGQTQAEANGDISSAVTSRWEVLPEDDAMATLEYLDSGVFAVPDLPGWREHTAVTGPIAADTVADEDTVPEVEIGPTVGLIAGIGDVEGPAQDRASDLHQDWDWGAAPAVGSQGAPEVDGEEDAAPIAEGDGLPEEDAALIEATVVEILARKPQHELLPLAPLTEAEEEDAIVAAILARAPRDVEDSAVDSDSRLAIMDAADPEPPVLEWERRPIAWDAAYFDNMKLAGDPVLVRKDREIDFDWGPQAPGAGVPAGAFSVRWRGTLVLDPGLYRFTLRGPDGVRLWLNDRLVLSAWYDQSVQSYAREFDWRGGSLYVRCEHYENGPEAEIHFDWERVL